MRSRDLNRGDMPQQPIVVVAFSIFAGGGAGWFLPLDELALGVLGVGLFGLAFASRSWWRAIVLMFYIGLLSTSLARLSEGETTHGVGALYQIDITNHNEGVMISKRDAEGVWQPLNQDVRLLSDPRDSLSLRSGDKLTLWSRPFSLGNQTFCRVRSGNIYELLRGEESPPWHSRLNSWGCHRIEQLKLAPKSEAICKAMLLGRREEIPSDLMRSYRRSGAAHLLAVSGLHVMILCFIASRIFMLLHLLPYGFQLRTIVVAAAVWCYAMVVGMSPSVERAAIMFMLLQAMQLFGFKYNTLSALAIALGIVTLCDPRIYFDVGFWLSFIAVLGIVVWVMPLSRSVTAWCTWCFGQWSIMKWVAESIIMTMMIGAACSVATLPIIAWSFGYVSPLGVLLNPFVMVTAYLLLLFSFVWCAVCGVWIVVPFRYVIDGLGWAQNSMVEYMSSSWRDAVELRISGVSVVLIYILYILATFILYEWRDARRAQRRN